MRTAGCRLRCAGLHLDGPRARPHAGLTLLDEKMGPAGHVGDHSAGVTRLQCRPTCPQRLAHRFRSSAAPAPSTVGQPHEPLHHVSTVWRLLILVGLGTALMAVPARAAAVL